MRTRAVLLALLTLLAIAAPAAAQSCPQTSLGDLEDEVMCPRCGRPLNTVDREPQAVRERAFMTRLIEQCKSKEEVKSALVAQFGPDVLALPDDGGFNTSAYIAPVLVPLAALGLIVLTATRWRRRKPAGTLADAGGKSDNEGPTIDPGDSARLDEDLERYKL